MRRLLVVVAVVVGVGVAVGLGLTLPGPAHGTARPPVTTVPPTNGGAPPPTSPPSKTVVLTNAGDGSTVVTSVGATVVVQLTGGPQRWSEARTLSGGTGAGPVLTVVSGSTTTSGSSTTTFTVTGHGRALVEATGMADCAVGMACPQYVRLWQATLSVPAA